MVVQTGSARSAQRLMSDNAVLAAMRRMGIGKDEMSGHGFRAVARTILDEVLGFRPDFTFIEHQLAHAVRDPNGRAYNRTSHLPERRKMDAGVGRLSRQAEGGGGRHSDSECMRVRRRWGSPVTSMQ